jgi:hypothetical protein
MDNILHVPVNTNIYANVFGGPDNFKFVVPEGSGILAV